LNSPLVQEWEQYYARRPEYVARMVERSSRYLYHVVGGSRAAQDAGRSRTLPMIESAYNPQAYSRSHATSGMWQFIPSTGKLYGLNQNFWLRRAADVLAATSAALDFWRSSTKQFGDWNLAFAAYNWGEAR